MLRYRLTPWWARVLVVFVLSRVVSTIALLTFAGAQQANAWTLASPDYGSFATIWDGHWYYIIAVVGYPSDLPITGDGHAVSHARSPRSLSRICCTGTRSSSWWASSGSPGP